MKILQELQRLRAKGDPRKIAVYFRQSTEAQIGNVSTTLQTVDMVATIKQAGWSETDIILVDMDGGVSGTKGIEERAGMSYLVHKLILKDEIAIVVVQAVDRLFRDWDQIDTNRFIKACREHDVQVLTPDTLFDFNDPRYGEILIKEFRSSSESGANFIRNHVQLRLHPAREAEIRKGKWAGQGIPSGYMVDDRKNLPDGSKNPNYRRIDIFKPYGDVIAKLFEMFYEADGNLLLVWKRMEQGQLSFPELKPGMLPEGFRIVDQLKRRSKVTGARVPAYTSLINILTNPSYIGYFSYRGEVLFMDHHPALVPEDLFWYAFNRLSKTTLNGEPNPDYIPHRPMVRQSSKDRPESPPVYREMIYSDDIVNQPNRRVTTQWTNTMSCYCYRLAIPEEGKSYWALTARNVDALIHDMLKEAVADVVLDQEAWQNALRRWTTKDHQKYQQLKHQLQDEYQAKEAILAGMRTYTDDELRHRAEENIKAIKFTIQNLEKELKALRSQIRNPETLEEARALLQEIVAKWDIVPDRHKRELMQLLAEKITMHRFEPRKKRITVYWRKGDTTNRVLFHAKGRGQGWSSLDRDNLKYMIENNIDQVEILQRFPYLSWRNLLDQYAYHYNNNSREGVYHGKKKYPQHIRWEQTEEYRQMKREENGTSSNPPMTAGTRRQFSPLDWFDLTEPRVFEVLRAMSGE